MADGKTKLGRRNFLLAVGAGGAATAIAVVATKPPQARGSISGHGKRSTRGYNVSEHINNYYRTTKV